MENGYFVVHLNRNVTVTPLPIGGHPWRRCAFVYPDGHVCGKPIRRKYLSKAGKEKLGNDKFFCNQHRPHSQRGPFGRNCYGGDS